MVESGKGYAGGVKGGVVMVESGKGCGGWAR